MSHVTTALVIPCQLAASRYTVNRQHPYV